METTEHFGQWIAIGWSIPVTQSAPKDSPYKQIRYVLIYEQSKFLFLKIEDGMMRETLRKANIRLEEFQDKLKNPTSEVRMVLRLLHEHSLDQYFQLIYF